MISILERGFRLGKHSKTKVSGCPVVIGGGLLKKYKELESVKKPKPKPKPKPKY